MLWGPDDNKMEIKKLLILSKQLSFCDVAGKLCNG